MSGQLIVIIINCIYIFLLLIIYFKAKRENNYESDLLAPLPYQTAGLTMVVIYVICSMLRNSDMFNYEFLNFEKANSPMFAISFLGQFILQLIILVLYLIPTSKILSGIHNWSILLMMLAALWTSLFKFRPIESNKIELSIKEIRTISKELTNFQEDVSNRIIGVNKNMESILADLRKKESDLNKLNTILNQKESELDEINSVITLDKKKVNDLMNYIEKDETIWEIIMTHLYTFGMGVFSGYVVLYLPLIKRQKNQRS